MKMEFINGFGYLVFFIALNNNKKMLLLCSCEQTHSVESQCIAAIHVTHTDSEFPFFMSLFPFWLFSRFKNLQ